MNDIVTVLIVLLEAFAIFALIFVFTKRSYFEKRKYKNEKGLNFIKALQPIPGSFLIMRRAKTLKYRDVLELKADIFWFELLLGVSGGGKGGYTKQIDTIYIKGDQFNYFRWISLDLVMGTLCCMDERGTLLIPSNIVAFLNKYNVSIDSGDWGLLLMKNSGFFEGSEVDEILKEIKDIKYLSKKTKLNN